MGPLSITNIGRLVTMEPARLASRSREARVAGGPKREGPLGVIEDAVLVAENEHIKWFGTRKEWLRRRKDGFEEFDVGGGIVTPGLIDCHTHLVHAGSRQNEFALRSQGKKYWEIAKAGGGIMSTVRATRKASYDELYRVSSERADETFLRGTLALEVKTGYGLDLQTELKILDVIRTLKDNHPIRFFATFLGAHVVPEEMKNRRRDYVRLVIDKMIPAVAKQQLSRFCDIFVEEGAFTPNEARAIAKAARKHRMGLRFHVDQFKDGGGALLAAELKAVSADHLDYISDKGIAALKKAGTVAVVLPGATFFTGGKHYAPARKMIDKGLCVAISTDYNPGTNPCLDLFMTATIAVSQMGLTLDEAWRAITINAAASLGIDDDCGTVSAGKRADLIVLDAPDEYFPMYRYGKNCVTAVIKKGRAQWLDEYYNV